VEDINETEVKRSQPDGFEKSENSRQPIASKVTTQSKVKKSGVLRPISARNKDKPEK